MSGPDPEQLRKLARAGSRAPRARSTAGPNSSVLRLQRAAGNRATAGLVQASRAPEQELQRFGMDDLKDAYKHYKDWRAGDDKATPENVEEWSEHSEEVALHSKQMLEAAKAAYDHAADQALTHGDSDALKEAREASEQIEHAGKLLESGERVFKYGVKTVNVIDELDKMYEAAKILSAADLGNPDTQQSAAAALDTLAGGFGRLGSQAVSDTPFKGYFDFVAQIDATHFFSHWATFIHNYTDRIDAASRSD